MGRNVPLFVVQRSLSKSKFKKVVYQVGVKVELVCLMAAVVFVVFCSEAHCCLLRPEDSQKMKSL